MLGTGYNIWLKVLLPNQNCISIVQFCNNTINTENETTQSSGPKHRPVMYFF